MFRLIAGLIVAPLVAAVVAVVGIVSADSVPFLARYLPPMGFPDDAPFLFAWALLFAGAVTAFGAAPIALWQRAHGVASLRRHLVLGALLGTSPFVLLGVLAMCFAAVDADWQRTAESTAILAPFAVIGGIAGTVSAYSFYLTVASRAYSKRGAA